MRLTSLPTAGTHEARIFEVMIDFQKIRERPTPGRILYELLFNAAQLFLIFYGLKCIIFRHGTVPVPADHRTLHWTTISGAMAVAIGLTYLGLGLFAYLSDGPLPEENRPRHWRICRFLVRWGSLVFAAAAALRALALSDSLLAKSLSFLAVIFLMIFSPLAVLSSLFAVFCREQVKKQIRSNGCQPLHVWWQPAAFWLWRCAAVYYHRPKAFRVWYADRQHFIHAAYCFVYCDWLDNPLFGPRKVRWVRDQVVGQLPLPEVSASDEIIRPKLEQDFQMDNPLKEPEESQD